MDWKRDTVNRPGDSLPLFDRRTHDSSLHAYDMEASCANRSSALAALRLLISYNHFLTPPVKQQSRTNVFLPEGQECQSNNWHRRRTFSGLRVSNTHSDVHSVVGPLLAALPPPPSCLPPYCQHLPTPSLSTCEEVRRRGEKRPIPPELKDDKYFERRRRNNQAAKKSRDARRIREDQIAWRACILEQENASLRAHVAALRQEALALRGLLAARDDALPSAAPAPPAPSSTTPD